MPTRTFTITRHYTSKAGVSTVEYAVLFSAIGLLAITGLSALGRSTNNLFTDSDTVLKTRTTLSVLNPGAASIAPNGPGSGKYYTVGKDQSGQFALQLTDSSSAGTTNVSSIDGSKMNTLGSMMIANSLADLAESQTNPELKHYYSKIARLSLYLGGAEGEIDGVPGLDLRHANSQGVYSKGDALRDIYSYQKQLQALMQNPPESIEPEDFTEMMPLAVEVNNIGQQYLDAFRDYISPDGQVTHNFGNPSRCDNAGCSIGDGTPGSGLKGASSTTHSPKGSVTLINQTYDQLVSESTIKQKAQTLLVNNQVDSLTVKTTLRNGLDIHEQSTTIRKKIRNKF